MKNFIYACIGVLVGLVLYAAADHFGVVPHVQKESTTTVTDAPTAEAAETFTDVNEFLNFVADLRDCAKADSILLVAPNDMIVNIASVCIKRYGKVDRATFYREYLSTDVYKLLPTQTNTQQPTQAAAMPPSDQGGTQAPKTDSAAQAPTTVTTPPNNN